MQGPGSESFSHIPNALANVLAAGNAVCFELPFEMSHPNELFMMCIIRRRRRQRRLESKSFKKQLTREERRLRRGCYSRAVILPPMSAPWVRVLEGSDDAAMITLTSLDRRAFDYLLGKFGPVYNQFTPSTKSGKIGKLSGAAQGRPRLMDAPCALGLCLAWMCTRGSSSVLCLLFGVTQPVLSLYLRYGRRILVKILMNDEYARVKLPTTDEIETYQEAIAAKHLLLVTVYGVMDGLKLPVQKSSDPKIQRHFYNGWTHGHYVTNILGFSPDGVVFVCNLNAPIMCYGGRNPSWEYETMRTMIKFS